MKAVITGATSMIGVSLIKSCLNNNCEILALVREGSNRINRIPKSNNIKIVECNLNAMYSQKFDDNNYDVFFHLGWDGTDKINRNNIDVQIKNIHYSLDAIKLAKNLGCKTFVGVGSQAEYGIKDKQLSSDMQTDPIISYGIAKLCSYYVTKQASRSLGIKHIWVRVLSVYGKNDNDGTLIQYLLENLNNNQEIHLTKCEQIWDYLYCDDAGDALYSIGQKGKHFKIYNLGSGTFMTLKEYVEKVKNIVNPSAIIHYGSKEYSNNQIMNLSTDISDITYDTGWKPKISFEEGINIMIKDIKGKI